MCGKAYDPRFLFAWPSAQVAVMSGAAAANTLLQIEKATLQAKGLEITPEKEKELFETIKARYDRQTSPYFAAARLWIDELILPSETRTMISMGLEAANHAPITREFNPGVLQT
jgi:acetyl-CoA carboxylase carboxyltransferase component